MLEEHARFYEELKSFAEEVTEKLCAQARGEPEDQLRGPTERLFGEYGSIISRKIILKGESRLYDRPGRPDFAASDEGLLVGYIELKAPGKGANPDLYKRHDREQWKRFKNVPNIIYSDGNEWGLYRNGELVDQRIRLSGDVRTDGKAAVAEADARGLFQLFAKFTSWTPIIPEKPKVLAGFLAPYCGLIRDEVLDALKDSESPMHKLKDEIKNLLFPEADEAQFADAYAQTVVFALLLAQMEGADVVSLSDAYDTLSAHHLLLSRSLQFLTDPLALKEISSSVELTQRVIHEIPKVALKGESGKDDPWLFFYEDFLAAYDPKLRKESGVYYTPVEVVRCQVRLIDEILGKNFGKDLGFVESGVATLDPGLGTGTYLLAIVDHALRRVGEEEGDGAVKGAARSLVRNLHGFEWMVGPYAVAQLRFTRALTAHGASLPKEGPGIYLTNTLESPHTKPPAPPLFHQPIAQEHERALKIKDVEPVLVCLGNPPYGRHRAATKDNRATTGGWVRHKDKSDPAPPILEDFLEAARKAGHGKHLKNLYNHYIYFIRWSLWKVFEHKTAVGPGIVSFITASSYLDGDAFVGVREHLRRICDHIDIIDLGGEGRGTRREENVFAIQTPVAIFVVSREGKGNCDEPAVVRYTRIEGSKEEKLRRLDGIMQAGDLKWQKISKDWQAGFRPGISGQYARWPEITDIFPWQHSGVMAGRTWVIGEDRSVLRRRWEALCVAQSEEERKRLFKESPTGRAVSDKPVGLPNQSSIDRAISESELDSPAPGAIQFGFRSFDCQMLIADNRVLDRPGPDLWRVHGKKQIYINSLINHPLGHGAGLTVTGHLPDKHFFRGSYGGKGVFPLYRDASATEANVLPGLLDLLDQIYGRIVRAEDLAGYVYGILAQPEYTRRFRDELSSREVRVPLTKDGGLFSRAAEFGKGLIWLHTYGERMVGKARPKGRIPKGKAKCPKAVPESEEKYPNSFEYDEAGQRLNVGEGCFGPVSREVFEFEVSGLKVVKSWLGYRMRERRGRKSSPLDDIRPTTWTHDFTRELLELLWVLEKTVEGHPKQKDLLEKVLGGELFIAKELPDVPAEARRAPQVKRKSKQRKLFED